jgi:S-adenosylmethionine synthetase
LRLVLAAGADDPDRVWFDVAERKGSGHPDTLADLAADMFSLLYSRSCVERFGVVLNHWVDKACLVGAASEVWFGGFRVAKPVGCYLFGKVTERVGAESLDVEGVWRAAVSEVFRTALADDDILGHVRLVVDKTEGIAPDHDREFYRPASRSAPSRVLATESVANDTVVCVGRSRPGAAARVALRLERAACSPEFRGLHPGVGTDVKVMAVRAGDTLDVTAAVPFHPAAVTTWRRYRARLAEVEEHLAAVLRTAAAEEWSGPIRDLNLHVNTKDSPGRGYLAPFGTSLGKGDVGVVGRGNRHGGVIEPLRAASAEAAAGKNPVHHAGKIYTVLAGDIARRVLAELGAYAEVTIVARNGEPLGDPAFVAVRTGHGPEADLRPAVETIVNDVVSLAATFRDRFLVADPLAPYRRGVPDRARAAVLAPAGPDEP